MKDRILNISVTAKHLIVVVKHITFSKIIDICIICSHLIVEAQTFALLKLGDRIKIG